MARSPVTWPSTPPLGAELDVPVDDAFAEPLVELVPVAVNVAAPVTASERFVVAVTLCVASVTAIETPTAAPEPEVDPSAVVVTVAVCAAETSSAPLTIAAAPGPNDASVVTVDSVTATEGAIATLPAAPVTELVVSVGVLVACSVTSCALSVPVTAAWVASVTRFSATAAPTPEPVEPAVAFAEEAVADVALTIAFAAGAFTAPERSARVCTFAIVSPSDPATAAEAAAPEIPSLDAPTPPLEASTSTAEADAVPASDAVLVTFASVIATPAPIAAEPLVAAPLAFAAAAAVSDEVTVSVPVTATVPPTVALAARFAIVTDTAAAADTVPPEVEAAGVAVPPDGVPPAPVAAASALERASPTCDATDGAPPDDPDAEAVLVPLAVLVPVAATVIDPPTVRVRALEADTAWFATVTATEAPTAAVPADVEPDAVVAAAAFWSALTESAPPSVAAAPAATDAAVVTVESVTATEGASETPPPAAPLSDFVVAVVFEEAWIERSCTPLRVEAAPVEAPAVSVTRFNATDAPRPAPASPAVAVAVDSLTDVARREMSPLVGTSGGPRA